MPLQRHWEWEWTEITEEKKCFCFCTRFVIFDKFDAKTFHNCIFAHKCVCIKTVYLLCIYIYIYNVCIYTIERPFTQLHSLIWKCRTACSSILLFSFMPMVCFASFKVHISYFLHPFHTLSHSKMYVCLFAVGSQKCRKVLFCH